MAEALLGWSVGVRGAELGCPLGELSLGRENRGDATVGEDGEEEGRPERGLLLPLADRRGLSLRRGLPRAWVGE